ncbi:MAG: substrate-binding domain-containing protein [Candidatus Sericytochromatia bacterium]
MSQLLRVGGVPEHFNAPWHRAIEKQSFARAGLAVDFQLYPTGTGAMCADLHAGRLDLAVVLTEGIVNDISRSNSSRIIGAYVPSPLAWGIHVAAQSRLQNIQDLRNKTFAISRFGSGSHLMAMLLAQAQGWDPREEAHFHVAGGIEPLEAAVCEGQADVFLWEKYTTAPRVEAGALKRLGEFPTPWPSFVIAARKTLIEKDPQTLQTLLAVLYQETAEFMADEAGSVAYVSERYALKLTQARDWFSGVKWATQPDLDPAMLTKVINSLAGVGMLEGALPQVKDLIL